VLRNETKGKERPRQVAWNEWWLSPRAYALTVGGVIDDETGEVQSVEE
jgi:hypothetical protein